ncbi:hypothetical protein V7112_01265 [Bacillus sp. JJ1566]|uniref:hypothetical protein n=1 Tax=Bacillus sp. JJ1566 TaxID=3122961 RepID=UPI002FFF1A2F
MKSLQDAIYNWLTIKVVAEARPDDTAAKETFDLFEDILVNEFKLKDIEIQKDDSFYFVKYTIDGEAKSTRFSTELIEIMHDQISQHPERYQNYE